MKPIKLVLSAFGPYAGQTTVDFTRYEEKGLFLITGPTGSGKTTIFDGISYALFGRASGEYRGTGHLRSDYAGDKVKTFVEFTFEHQGHTYVVRREPEQERPKQRGEGTIVTPESVQLSQDGGVPIEKVRTVNERISNLLNISYSQFKQIAMIAQSEFYSLLNASTDDRTVILRSIFSTDGYNQIGIVLKKYSDESRSLSEEAKRSIIQYFSDVRIDEECEDESYADSRSEYLKWKTETVSGGEIRDIDALMEAVRGLTVSEKAVADRFGEQAALKDREAETASRKLATAVENNKRIDDREKAEKEYDALLALEPEMRLKRENYERRRTATHEIRPSYDRYTAQVKRTAAAAAAVTGSTSRLEAARAEAEKCAALAEEVRKEEPQAAEKEAEASRIAHDREDYLRLSELKTGIEKRKVQQEQNQSGLKSEENRIRQLDEEIRKNEELQKELTDVPVKLTEEENRIRRIQDLQKRIHPLVTGRAKEYRKLAAELEELQAAYKDASDSYDRAREESERAEKAYEFNLAGILAKDLEEGKPCPVCGSIHHPDKAVLPEHSVTEDEVNKVKEKAETARNAKEEALAGAREKNAAASSEGERLKADLIAVLEEQRPADPESGSGAEIPPEKSGSGYLSESLEGRTVQELIRMAEEKERSIAADLTHEQEIVTALQKDRDRLRQAADALEKAKESRQAAEERRSSLSTALQEITGELSRQQGQLESLQKLSFENWEKAREQMNLLTAAAKDIRNRISAADQQKTASEQAMAGFEAEKKSHEEALEKEKTTEAEYRASLEKILVQYGYTDDKGVQEYFAGEAELNRESDELQQFDRQKEVAKAGVEKAAEDAKGRERADTDALNAEYTRLREEAQKLHSQQNDAAGRIRSNETVIRNIEGRKSDFETARKRYNTARTLYRLVSGQTSSGKITFEQYVQAAKFDGIIRAANRRLSQMSGGQYELFRQSGSIGKRTNTFLDLEVLDHYTGKRRPVNTLSGGESFDASLSLALGLSDTISSNLGGIQIDALFVDEGFGTLDRDSIARVLETLRNLSGSHKLVGVISHREELSEAIPQKIIVEKGPEGSFIREEDDL